MFTGIIYFHCIQLFFKVSFFGRIVQCLLKAQHFVFFGVITNFRNLFCVSNVADLIGYQLVLFDIFVTFLPYFLEISYVLDALGVEGWPRIVELHGVVPESSVKGYDFPCQSVVEVLFQRMFVFGVFYECLKLCCHSPL